MKIEAHDLHHDFPEMHEQISTLKTTDRHFSKLFEEYHQLDLEIHKIEEGKEASSDERLETMKLRRVALKDELYGMLKVAS
ncbi:MAG: YdcH family protein [Oceanobacter sp.]